MAIKPILFSTPMIKAILEGRKTMTRRAINGEPGAVARYQPGDVLWVRETWLEHKGTYIYKAEGKHEALDALIGAPFFKWRPSIFMPAIVARILLRITAVRAERLKDITDEDAIREGIIVHVPVPGDGEPMPRLQFRNLWDHLNAKRAGGQYAWAMNPWVWVYSFERIEKPEGWPQ